MGSPPFGFPHPKFFFRFPLPFWNFQNLGSPSPFERGEHTMLNTFQPPLKIIDHIVKPSLMKITISTLGLNDFPRLLSVLAHFYANPPLFFRPSLFSVNYRSSKNIAIFFLLKCCAMKLWGIFWLIFGKCRPHILEIPQHQINMYSKVKKK